MDKKSILFVDDEPNILSGIKRMLRSMRDEFDFYFAESGNDALAVMEKEMINIVVSDMRMPGMDGADLLTQIKERHPQAIRIMLTGQADDESIMKTVNVVHQFLSKPCEADQLKDILRRSHALLNQMGNNRLRDIISGIDSLPSLPSVYAKLQEVLKDPEATADQVAAVIEQDIAMTAKLLQLVNSSFFGLFQKVESPARAVKLLGLETIKILVLGVQIFAEIKARNEIISFDYLWKHSMSVAHCSQKIAIETTDDQELINNCFIAGLLHDIGRLLLVSKLAEEYKPIVEAAKNEQVLLIRKEADNLLTTHADIGAYLIGLWGFNGEVVEAVAFHNDLDNYPATGFTAALAVHIADACYYRHHPDDSIGPAPQINEACLDRLGQSDKKEMWSNVCAHILEGLEDGA